VDKLARDVAATAVALWEWLKTGADPFGRKKAPWHVPSRPRIVFAFFSMERLN
jgi:hypothetical protein